MMMEGEIAETSTSDSDAAVHPKMTRKEHENESLPSPPLSPKASPPRLFSKSPTSSPKGTHKNNLDQLSLSPQSPPTGLQIEPVGLTLNIRSPHGSAAGTNGILSPIKSAKNANQTLQGEETILEIEEGTPAAEALRANADVRVTKVGKVARYLQVQAVRKTAKSILHVGTGVKRGKPPRLPDLSLEETFTNENTSNHLSILPERDEDEDDDEDEEEDFRYEGDKKEEKLSVRSLPVEPPTPLGDDLMKSAHSHASEIPIPRATSSSSSDSSVPSKLAIFSKSHKITLLDTKGKKREVRLIKKERKKEKKLKKKEKKKAKRNYVKGKVIDGHHELYALSIAMMLGLRYSIFLTNNQLMEDRKNDRVWLDSDEFMKVEKYIFRPDGRNNTPPHQLSHTFKFKDYSPLPFAFIRRMFGINEFEFNQSVCGNANFIEFISNAKSGQFFFYSNDGRYMIKTMTNQESKFLRRILPHYFRHCSQNPNTILTKFLGMYRVKLYHLRKNVKFVIMNSVFDTDKVLSSFYDLKGSVVGRTAKRGESVLKDNDLRKESGTIRLYDDSRLRLREQVRRDCDFLKSMKIMDYSMLVGIHYIPSRASKSKKVNGVNFRTSARRPKPLERSRSDSGASEKSTLFVPLRPLTGTNKKHKRSRSAGLGTFSFSTTKHRKSFSDTDSPILDSPKFNTPKEKENCNFCPAIPIALPSISKNALDKPAQTSPNSLMDEQQKSIASTSSIAYEEEEEDQSLLGKADNSIFSFDLQSPDSTEMMNEEMRKECNHSIEKQKELAIEQNYWPFHRNYELNGDRRVYPMQPKFVKVQQEDPDENIADATCTSTCLGDPSENEPDLSTLRGELTLDSFTPPISSRRDGGLMMDTSGLILPFKSKVPGGKTQKCDGKIYYMGIIDILQQFNGRKRIEARYRKVKGGEKKASCVHPHVYADRFVEFFEEYTLGKQNTARHLDHDDGLEEVIFDKESIKKTMKKI